MSSLISRIAAIGSWGDLKSRVISAVLLGLAVIAVTLVGGFAFRILCVAIGVIVFDEWSRMTRSKHRAGPLHPFARRCLYLTLLLFLFGLPELSLLILVGGVVFITFVDRQEQRAIWTLGGLVYAAAAALPLGLLRADSTEGLIALGYVVAIVWSTDIFAYFTGRSIGGPKLMPIVSPKKTISGAIGGLIAGVVAACLFLELTVGSVSWGLAILAAFLSALGQAGDLYESWIKRRFGVKDSGRVIPGHGGIMDRIDALIVAVAAAFLIGAAFASPFDPARGLI
ncbi:MAG: phosphatidate cytidylyltransferase [Fulvimarina manganoxydans]|uniref:phosphatidate cytidylyltransferase n=1 Tax=Fulvimarina manganoxydans TaxID=937218 RepID=UPI00235507E9|nr:phosphatidate cytidylyltransferase [Fulvimarina manganoxydans]MCK5933214.1 phosphatidate cytidylyltransferase [Fulvimarina manganoxydans]MEE2950518.1 phosphatidate cytidylyltransferase [Pseudomonadota bacterium]